MGWNTEPRSYRWVVSLVCLALLLPVNVFPFEYPLQPEAVEQAYSLGRTRNHEELSDFLNKYEHDFKPPAVSQIVYVTSVEFQTPYDQIVLKSFHSMQYDKFKAAEDYQAGAGAVFVRVVVALRMNYTGPVPAADSLQVKVSQTRPIEPAETTTRTLCNPYNVAEWGSCSTYTCEILLRFDHHQFGPGKVTVKVFLPEDKSLETQFNLDKLK